MRQNHMNCDEKKLSEFLDGELNPEDRRLVRGHLEQCRDCRSFVEQHRAISAGVQEMINSEFSVLEIKLLKEKTLKRLMSGNPERSLNKRKRWDRKWIVIPATAMAALVIFFLTVFRSTPVPAAQPSAIVSSFSGDVSSVYIMETPESHQTIIWITETVDNENRKHEV